MSTPPTIRTALVAAITEHGPMTAAELADVTGLDRKQVNGAFIKARGLGLFHIAAWRRQPPGQRGAMAPVYNLGDQPDAPKPRARTQRERNATYRKRHRAVLRAKALKTSGAQQHRLHPFSELVRVAVGAAG